MPCYDADHPPPYDELAMLHLAQHDPFLRFEWRRHAAIADQGARARVLFTTFVLGDTAMIAEYARYLGG